MEPSPEAMEVDKTEPRVKLRSYQQEMLEASLARNVIVAMETGSGKTPVATFRILAELERTDNTKLVWFIAPKVALCDQQYEIMSDHLPGYLVKKLLGSDGVDKWTDQKLWDVTLANVRVVVGTPAVLADALTHGFLHISRLSLLVFDEAHNCIGNSPMNRIMRDFYHPAKDRLGPVPHVLGLSASPVISAKSTSLSKLEASLDAIAITPKQHRLDLDVYVHPPEVLSVAHARPPAFAAYQVPLLAALTHAVQTYDLSTDPYIMELRQLAEAGDEKAYSRIDRSQLKRNTWCLEQLSAMLRKATAVLEQLGASAAEWYISECQRQYAQAEGSTTMLLPDMSQKERTHLFAIFRAISSPQPDYTGDPDYSAVTPKVQRLVDTLLKHSSTSSKTRAVIFAEQRAVVLALGLLLRMRPELAASYVFGTYIGTSTSERRKTAVADLIDLKAQAEDLKSFRANGRISALVATSVLEEGIDVSACNLVICFDPPKNLVQFVQRRGRARQKDSKYIVLVPDDDYSHHADRWGRLEQQMKELYRDEEREAGVYADDDEPSRSYRVDSTGALLHFDNAKAHLYHFCAVSTRSGNLVDVRPEFSADEDTQRRWTATVHLPAFVHSSLRTASSSERWSKEETAIKDAAFEAYVALHKAGLVNDNLLPRTQDYGPNIGEIHVDQPSIVSVAETQSSWRALSERAAASDARWNAHLVRMLREDSAELASLTMHLPTPVGVSQHITLYWNEKTSYTVEIGRAAQASAIDADPSNVEALQDMTDHLLRSVYASGMEAKPEQLPFLFSSEHLRQASLHRDNETQSLDVLRGGQISSDCGIVHLKGQPGRRYFLSGIEALDTEPEECSVILSAFPKRRDFLHPLQASTEQNEAYTAKQVVPRSYCVMDTLPARYSIFAAFLPSILRRVDTSLLAADLQSTVLSAVLFDTPGLIIEAISSPSARETSDYNRLEFLGDAILKFCASLHVMAKHPTWPEGYLGLEKSRIVSNNALAKAASIAGLEKYIITKAFTGAKWRPPYISKMLGSSPGTREISSKVLADVVEALIGAAFVDGGLDMAHTCIRTLLPDEQWIALPDCVSAVATESTHGRHVDLGLLQRVVGHTFNNPELLIEALTHASFPHTGGGSSYERLEFLGDAVLDLLIVPKLFIHRRKPRHYDLHRMRDALVNGDYLAYCCMQHSAEEDRFDVVSQGQEFDVQQSKHTVHLHDFLRAGAQVTKAKRECLELAGPRLESIKFGLKRDSQYPWPELIAFKPPKFFSDIIESTLAAVFLDSGGDLTVCESFVEKIGIFEMMCRILDEDVETAYPKEQLGILADKERVDYVCSTRTGGDGAGVMFDCIVKVGQEDVSSVFGCGSKEEAQLRAARKAIVVMERKVGPGWGRKKRKLDVALHDQEVGMGATEGDEESEGGVSIS